LDGQISDSPFFNEVAKIRQLFPNTAQIGKISSEGITRMHRAALSRETFLAAEKAALSAFAIDRDYPLYVQHLLNAGVASYSFDVATRVKRVFSDTGDSFELAGSTTRIVCNNEFNESNLREALRRSVAGVTNYTQFLEEIASAGVHSYNADLKNNLVTYYGKDKSKFFGDPIPAVKRE
jgi:uncharacterized protein YbcV (DUF1398 family)